jgi:hypothetical protein
MNNPAMAGALGEHTPGSNVNSLERTANNKTGRSSKLNT